MPLTLTALILAGGQSSRMGRDKALLTVQGVPLIRRTCQVALDCTDTVAVITFWPDRYRSHILDSCQLLQEVSMDSASLDEHKVVQPNQSPSHGPLVGFAQGLAYCQTDWVLLLACDLPNLEAETLIQWRQLLSEVPEEVMACLPRGKKGWEPLCGFYRRDCLLDLTDFIGAGGRSFQGWLDRIPVQALPLADPHVLFNCNTPEDFQRVGD